MGAERDPAGQARPDMSPMNTPRDSAGLNAGTTGSQAMGDRPAGVGEVHTGLHTGTTAAPGRTGAGEYGSLAFDRNAEEQGLGEKARNRIGGMAEDVKSRAQDAVDRAPEIAGQVRDRAGEYAGQAREKVGQALERAEQELDRRGVLDKVRQNPMPALGIAFGIGFLLAGSGDDQQGGKQKKGTLSKAKHQIKGAVMGGLSAAIAQEARSLIGMAKEQGGSSGGLLGSVMETLQGGGGQQGSRSGSSGSSSASASSSGTVHREPSHRENL